MMAFDSTSSDMNPIGTFSSDLKGMGKAIDCRTDGTKVTNPIYLTGPRQLRILTFTFPSTHRMP